MVDEFWRQYNQYRFALFYHEYERSFLNNIATWTSVVSYAITAASLIWWSILQQYELIWAILIFASQIAGNYKDQFQLGKRIWSLDAYTSHASQEINKMSETWRQIYLGKLSDEEIFEKISASSVVFSDISEKYIRPFSAREYTRLIKKADEKTNRQMVADHGKGEDIVYAKQQPASG